MKFLGFFELFGVGRGRIILRFSCCKRENLLQDAQLSQGYSNCCSQFIN